MPDVYNLAATFGGGEIEAEAMSVVELVTPLHQSRVGTFFNGNQHNTLWISMRKAPDSESPNFSLDLLREGSALYKKLQNQQCTWLANGAMQRVHYAVLKSEHPDYFSLGGDLRHFRECIKQRDSEGLRAYAMLCMDMVYDWATRINHQSTSVTLVQGRALGGGFEAALASDYLIAEEHSEFGFPEILFGLFPCTGGMSLLSRRVGLYEAERMMSNGKIYSARELFEKGVVDVVCPQGGGEAAVEKFIAAHAKHRGARMALQRARNRLMPLRYDELRQVVNDWVDAAMTLPAEELRVMDMLIKMQGARSKTA
jgi:DSF synthase